MAALKRVAVVFTGGTISMVVDREAGGAIPSISGRDILDRTPGLERTADVIPVDRGLVPASHFTFPALFELATSIRGLLADPALDGVVLVQGTDTIEETSFLLDLLLDSPKPLVVTGAMRNAAQLDYDGPSNLRDAVACSVAPALRGAGVVVVLGGTIEPADDVIKTHTSALDAFRSLNAGRIGRVEHSDDARHGVQVPRVVLERPRGPRRSPLDVATAAGPIPIVTATVAMDAGILDAAAALEPAGIVIAATGAGNTSPDLLAAGMRAMALGIPVVLASRCPSGAATAGYAFPGGGGTWVRAGAMLAGTLSAPKARIALAVGLGAGLEPPALSAYVAGPNAGPPGVVARWPAEGSGGTG